MMMMMIMVMMMMMMMMMMMKMMMMMMIMAKDYKIGVLFFSAKHAALMSKSKDWLARNRVNVSE
jgi:hypothetical protein